MNLEYSNNLNLPLPPLADMAPAARGAEWVEATLFLGCRPPPPIEPAAAFVTDWTERIELFGRRNWWDCCMVWLSQGECDANMVAAEERKRQFVDGLASRGEIPSIEEIEFRCRLIDETLKFHVYVNGSRSILISYTYGHSYSRTWVVEIHA